MGKHNYKTEFKNLFEEIKPNLDNPTKQILEDLLTLSSREIFDYWNELSNLLFQRYKHTLQQLSKELQKSETEISDSFYLDDCTCALKQMEMGIRKYLEDNESEYERTERDDFIDSLKTVISDLIEELKITGQTIDFFIDLDEIKNC